MSIFFIGGEYFSLSTDYKREVYYLWFIQDKKIVLVHSALEVGPRLFSAQVIVILVLPQTLHVAHHELLALS